MNVLPARAWRTGVWMVVSHYGHWESNSGPLLEYQVLYTTEPAIAPASFLLAFKAFLFLPFVPLLINPGCVAQIVHKFVILLPQPYKYRDYSCCTHLIYLK